MGQNYQDGKYALFMSLFASFQRDLESKGAIIEPRKKNPVDQYTKESKSSFRIRDQFEGHLEKIM